jgi:uncharacterized RDD family membrane protein YckC
MPETTPGSDEADKARPGAYPPPPPPASRPGSYLPPPPPCPDGGSGGPGYLGYGPPPDPGSFQGPYQPGAARPYGQSLAGWWRRFGGLLIDDLVFLVLAFGLELGPRGLAVGVAPVLQFLYVVLLIGARGQTLGMMAVGIRLRDLTSGEATISYRQSATRAFVVTGLSIAAFYLSPIFLLVLVLDYLFPLWDSENQTLHDKVARTVAVLES